VAKIEAKARAKPKEELDVSVYACLECFKKADIHGCWQL
jgi:hypothetical protein